MVFFLNFFIFNNNFFQEKPIETNEEKGPEINTEKHIQKKPEIDNNFRDSIIKLKQKKLFGIVNKIERNPTESKVLSFEQKTESEKKAEIENIKKTHILTKYIYSLIQNLKTSWNITSTLFGFVGIKNKKLENIRFSQKEIQKKENFLLRILKFIEILLCLVLIIIFFCIMVFLFYFPFYFYAGEKPYFEQFFALISKTLKKIDFAKLGNVAYILKFIIGALFLLIYTRIFMFLITYIRIQSPQTAKIVEGFIFVFCLFFIIILVFLMLESLKPITKKQNPELSNYLLILSFFSLFFFVSCKFFFFNLKEKFLKQNVVCFNLIERLFFLMSFFCSCNFIFNLVFFIFHLFFEKENIDKI